MTTFQHVIIGAGIIGLTTALELVREGIPGQSIAVVDPAPISGASWVAGGMLAPVAEVQYGQEALYPLMMRSAELWPDLIAFVRRLSDLPTGFRDESTLVVAADRADATHLSELMEHQSHNGMTIRRIPLRRARAIEPGLSPQLSGAVEIPGDHQVNPRLFCAATMDALARCGVTMVRAQATGLLTDAGTCTAVKLRDGNVVGVEKSVYLCNGLGANDVEGAPRLPVRPVRGDLVRLAVPHSLPTPVDRVIRGFVEDRPIYVIPRTDATIAVGATSREDDRVRPGVDGVHTLLRDAIRVVPGLEECEFVEALAGARPGTPDDLPLLGTVGTNVVVSNGYFRHGILLCALGARAGVAMGLHLATPEAATAEATAHEPLDVASRAVGVDLSACALGRL
ncbi:glycine oxidase ThiO [Corynebacterium auriscanis]|uniref:glycine oxidase ThiO n=1 Tax=Corynebacterium auriscanis TaxID=99807 RepID=UPI0022474A9B|nr:glycine oxidase ThiO [Corynebacterium auriscanis]MCX2164140.1 glycine oxidase ThiO [Corynebacterium auriscanis]